MNSTITPTTVAHPLDWQRKPQREIRTRWILGQTADGSDVVVELSTTHRAESKRYRSTVTWATIDKRDGFSTWCWASDHAYGVLVNQATPRYSAKDLATLHEQALAIVEADSATHVFNEASAQVTA